MFVAFHFLPCHKNMKAFTFILIAFTATFHKGLSKKIEGVIDSLDDDKYDDRNWTFLTRFCFMSSNGKLTYDFAYPKKYATQNLLFYYDTPGQWEAAYRDGKSCEEKKAVIDDGNVFALDPTACTTETRDGDEWYRCQNTMGFRSARERWWYMVIERCEAPQLPSVQGIYIEYYVHMTNGDDLLHKEYSADEFYILVVDIVFFIIYIVLTAASIIVAIMLKSKNILHTTYKMYLASLIIWTFALMFLVIAWASYGNTGWEKTSTEVFGRLLQTTSSIVFILQLILMAKGYTIVRGRLTNKATMKILIFVLLYSVGTITLYAWEANYFDPGLVLYYYESPPGYAMIGMQLLGWLWLTKAAVFTLKHYSKSTSRFYIPFYIIYSVWFWTGPIVLMLAMMSMAKWKREKTVHGVQQLVALLGHLFFFMLTVPCKVNTNFPYNVKSSQIGDVTSDVDSNVANAYVFDYDGVTGPNLDIFMTSNTPPGSEANLGQRMFGPLDAAGFTNNYSTSPPPSYSDAANYDPLPPIGGAKLPDADPVATAPNPQPTNLSEARESDFQDLPHGQLPPIQGHLPPINTESERSDGELRLPPLRASGLPPILPAAPLISNGDVPNSETQPLAPSYADLFRAK